MFGLTDLCPVASVVNTRGIEGDGSTMRGPKGTLMHMNDPTSLGNANMTSNDVSSLVTYTLISNAYLQTIPSTAMVSLVDVGVLRDTLLPNLAFHSSLAVPAYLIGRGLDRLVAKDVLWSTGQISNVLYSSIMRPALVHGVPLERVIRSITRPGWVTIAGVSLWGTRLAYRVISRTVASGQDDPRYASVKQDPSGWTKAFFTTFVPEAIVQSLITLAVTIPFRAGIPVIGAPREYAGLLDGVAIGLWSAGFALEVLADWQLATHQQYGDKSMLREGVWSIVRHPK